MKLQCAYNYFRIHPEKSNEILYGEVEEFISELNKELALGFNVKFDKLYITKVILPVSTFYAEGKVKFHDAEKIGKIIYFLQNLATFLTISS